MKFDIVMWTLNGEHSLPAVLKRIENAISREYVHKKIIVDDHSTDNTVAIAKEFNWEVYPNPFTGIPSGANEALRHVDCKYFLALEQDVVLAYNWIEIIPKLLDDPNTVAAEGIRHSTNPIFNAIENYFIKRVASISPISIVDAPSIDNTLFKTNIVKSVGGFPTDCPLCSDTILLKKLLGLDYKWLVDTRVISDHIKLSVRQIYAHIYYNLSRCSLTPLCSNIEPSRQLNGRVLTLLKSPMRALLMSLETEEPRIFFVYPLERLHYVRATSKLYKYHSYKQYCSRS